MLSLKFKSIDKCPLCGSRERQVYRSFGVERKRLFYWFCVCGFVYLAMEPTDLRALYDWYTETVAPADGGDELIRKHEEFRAKRVAEMIQLDGVESVIDVGCARGLLLEEFRKRGIRTYGVDIRDIIINPEQRVYSNIANVPEKVDLITCIHTLEHMHHPIDELIAMRKMLNDPGKIVVEAPSLGDPCDMRIFHPSLFTKWTLGRAISLAGMQVNDVIQLMAKRFEGSEAEDLILIAGGTYESRTMATPVSD